MASIVRCSNPTCARASRIPDHLAGKPIKCPGCGSRLAVLESAPQEPSLPSGDLRSGSPTRSTRLEKVGRFAIRARLGAGAFGTVYRAYDPQLDREVALKVPNPGVLSTPGRVERFLREGKAAAGLRHPHIVPVYDAGQDGERYFIAAAFVDGETLSHAVEEQSTGLDFARAARLVRELAEALAYAHGEGIVHRDVKSANCIVDAQDRLHLMDFGLAARDSESSVLSDGEGSELPAAVPDSRLTVAGSVLGTPAYMSPEQANGQIGEIGPAADQYACGIVLYELLTGRTPFEGPAPVVIHNQIYTAPEPPSKHRPGLPRDLETICLRALAKHPWDRYLNCQALAEDLRRWLDGEPIRARQQSYAERFGRWARKNRVVASLATALVLALVGGLAASLSFARQAQNQSRETQLAADRERSERQKAEQAVRLLQAEQDRLRKTAYISDMHLAQIAWDEGRMARMREVLDRQAQAKELLGPEWHYLRRLPQQAVRTLGTSAFHNAVAMAPDGNLVAWGTPDGKVALFQPSVGSVRVLLETGTNRPLLALAIHPSGRSLIALDVDGRLLVWDALDGSIPVRYLVTLKVSNLSFSHFFDLAVSPDGHRAAIAVYREAVSVVDLATGQLLFHAPELPHTTRAIAFSRDSKLLAIATEYSLRVHDLDGKEAREYVPPQAIGNSMYAVAFLAEDSLLVAGTVLGELHVWDTRSREHVRSVQAHNDCVTAIQVAADERLLITSSNDQTIRIWNTKTWEGSPAYRGPEFSLCDLSADRDLRVAVTAMHNGEVQLWHLERTYPYQTLQGAPESIRNLTFGGAHRLFLASDTVIQVRDDPSASPSATIPLASPPFGLASSADGQSLWVAEADAIRRVLPAGAPALRMARKDFPNQWSDHAIALSPDGRLVVARESDGFSLWSAESGLLQNRISRPGLTAESVGFTSDGKEVILGSNQGVSFWSVPGLTPGLSFGAQMARVAISPRKDWIAIGGWGGDMRVYFPVAGGWISPLMTKQLKQHSSHVRGLMITADGSRLISVGNDKSVCIWDTASWQEALSFRDVHREVSHGVPMGAAISADGQFFVTASPTRALLWDCRPLNR